MTNDPKLQLMGEILAIISNSNDLAAMLEKLMNDDPKDDHYTLDAVTLVTVISSMKLTAKLATNLFEENQSLVDNFVKLLHKHGISVPDGV